MQFLLDSKLRVAAGGARILSRPGQGHCDLFARETQRKIRCSRINHVNRNRSLFRHLVHQSVHRGLQALEFGLDQTMRLTGTSKPRPPAQIVPFRSYGTATTLIVRGRVLRNRPMRPSETDSRLLNAVHMVQRWSSREVAGVQVRARYGSEEVLGVTDDEGYIDLKVPVPPAIANPPAWREVTLDLPGNSAVPVAVAKVLVPPPAAQFGVISDVDDTVVFSSATNYLRMARIIFLGTAFSRLPFRGVAAFYRGLEKGTAGEPVNPFFYVSSSPWNLYDVLRDLFEYRSIPAGPLLLQDFGVDRTKLFHDEHRTHKLRAITDILVKYPATRFILIGDSGQKDPEIYREVVQAFPERVLAIYIRDVSREPERDVAIQQLREEVRTKGCDLLLVQDTTEAARHALEHGWLEAGVLREIEEEKASEPAKEKLEEVLGQQ